MKLLALSASLGATDAARQRPDLIARAKDLGRRLATGGNRDLAGART